MLVQTVGDNALVFQSAHSLINMKLERLELVRALATVDLIEDEEEAHAFFTCKFRTSKFMRLTKRLHEAEACSECTEVVHRCV